MPSKPLKLELDEHALTFATLEDFDFSMSGRSQVSAGAVTYLMQLSPGDLRREATSIRDLERRFVDLLADTLKDPQAVGRQLQDVDPALFAEDNRWRQIIAALMDQGPGFEEYKRIALVKYVQYLAARRDIVKGIYAQKFAGHEPLASQEAAANSGLKETLIIEDESGDHAEAGPVRYQRLPRGETMGVPMPDNGKMPIVLSRHKFVLFAGHSLRLTDDNGVNYPLKSGINVVGRHPDNDVVVGGWYRDVSRKHLMLDASRADVLKLTDLSTHGTYLPDSLLAAATPC